ncbi:MFS transporter [Nonomuraea jiangxiensis]|uniref:Major Facilitator Superfamily protein n=1 Tax=Nonomuraea jiangxiensis TaxID=633440 RepID=A0A1G9CJS3_9ACTN|nr:MFS transporter [Nonomuraea jiangxiensis]SDK51879.1 Major Facilitator Superfamily protein [Nonomuraea jiangxiensis]
MPYRTLLGLPGVTWQAVLGFLAQLTQQVAPVGIVLVIQYASGSLALAGATAGAFSVGAGMGRPVHGRLMDRHGPGPVLVATALVHTAALVALAILARGGPPSWWAMVALAWLAGAGLPPISLSMRIAWGRRMADSGRTAAYSLVYLVQELAFLIGPLVFGLLIAVTASGAPARDAGTVASSSVALVVVAVAAGLGTLAFARALRAGSVTATRERGRVFADRRMLVLVSVVALLGGTLGALQVGLPALAAARDAPAATGLLVAALSLGGIAGAAVYGARSWASSPAVRMVGLLLALGVAVAPLVLIEALPVVWIGLFAAGLAFNPAMTTTSLLVDELAPAAQAEAFGWASTAVGMGSAAGSAVAGVVGEGYGASAPFLAATAFALVGAGLAGTLRRRG